MSSQPVQKPKLVSAVLARLGQIAAGFIVLGAILFLAAGRLDWVWGWVFLGVYLADVAVNAVFMLRTGLETIAERGRPGDMRTWDKIVSGLWSVAQYILLPLIAGLDQRFGWTGGIGIGWQFAGTAGFAAGLGLFGWAMISNAYFSTVVRIQSERGQTVCRSGPYRFVRHPGYTGAILQSLAIPFLLGSLWALIPGAMAGGFIVIRTALEDRTLQAELAGYQDFVQEVRYRLVPGIW